MGIAIGVVTKGYTAPHQALDGKMRTYKYVLVCVCM